MSIISELVDKLKKYAAEYDLPPFGREIEGTPELLLEAADTIETLSAKLVAVNMEQSDKYYGGGWISVEDRLPEDDTCVLVQVNGKHKNITFENAFEFATYIKGEGWVLEVYPDWYNPNIIAWQPLPEPYH